MRRHTRFLILVGILLILGASLLAPFFIGIPTEAVHITWGVTFSKSHAKHLLGDRWREAYTAALDDLRATHVRIPFNWNDIEPEPGRFSFDEYDFMLREAEKRGVKVLAVVGHKLPRWPECHTPSWVTPEVAANEAYFEDRVIGAVRASVLHFKDSKTIWAWQVENEPFVFFFGECPQIPARLVAREVQTVRALDHRPIVMTDSGELAWWARSARFSDVLGVTLYRWTWGTAFGYQRYPLPPVFYARKAALVRKLYPLVERVIVTELQMEPWSPGVDIKDLPLVEQYRTMNVNQFRDNITFARVTGFDEFYLWGVEWWYWLKVEKGEASIWNAAKGLWKNAT